MDDFALILLLLLKKNKPQTNSIRDKIWCKSSAKYFPLEYDVILV